MLSFSYPAAIFDDAKADGFGKPNALPVTFVVDANGIVQHQAHPRGNAAYGENSLTRCSRSCLGNTRPPLHRIGATPVEQGSRYSWSGTSSSSSSQTAASLSLGAR